MSRVSLHGAPLRAPLPEDTCLGCGLYHGGYPCPCKAATLDELRQIGALHSGAPLRAQLPEETFHRLQRLAIRVDDLGVGDSARFRAENINEPGAA